MKKVGIITIFDENNYGNRLQNYATQEVLNRHQLNAITILNNSYYNNHINLLKFYIRLFLDKTKETLKKEKRVVNFRRFDQKFINTGEFIHIKNAHKIVYKYDYFICGSDQVWNPYFLRLSPIDLLTFSPKEKNIALSASFGVSRLENQHYEKCKNNFKNFKAISVREDQAQNILKDMGIYDSQVLIDPTMMLTSNEWEKLESKPSYVKKNYIVIYYLGNMSKEQKSLIENIANHYNLDIIYLCDENFSEYYASGPDEFLYLIHHANLVITDSFHACVFSILYKVPFYVFERVDDNVKMNSRIETLLSKFNLKNRLLKDYSSYDLNINYDNVDIILEKERKKFNDFIEENIN